nr:hypothetical protein [Marseillevirus cajuinensis]
MSSVLSQKALYTTQIDPQSAERAWSERFNLASGSLCNINPLAFNRDQYGRMADPYSLKKVGAGSCNAVDPNYNLQAFIARENAVDRPVIAVDMSQRYMYDTMGVGRQQPLPTQCGEQPTNWWFQTGMNSDVHDQMACQSNGLSLPPQPVKSYTCPSSSLSSMFFPRYNN